MQWIPQLSLAKHRAAALQQMVKAKYSCALCIADCRTLASAKTEILLVKELVNAIFSTRIMRIFTGFILAGHRGEYSCDIFTLFDRAHFQDKQKQISLLHNLNKQIVIYDIQ